MKLTAKLNNKIAHEELPDLMEIMVDHSLTDPLTFFTRYVFHQLAPSMDMDLDRILPYDENLINNLLLTSIREPKSIPEILVRFDTVVIAPSTARCFKHKDTLLKFLVDQPYSYHKTKGANTIESKSYKLFDIYKSDMSILQDKVIDVLHEIECWDVSIECFPCKACVKNSRLLNELYRYNYSIYAEKTAESVLNKDTSRIIFGILVSDVTKDALLTVSTVESRTSMLIRDLRWLGGSKLYLSIHAWLAWFKLVLCTTGFIKTIFPEYKNENEGSLFSSSSITNHIKEQLCNTDDQSILNAMYWSIMYE